MVNKKCKTCKHNTMDDMTCEKCFDDCKYEPKKEPAANKKLMNHKLGTAQSVLRVYLNGMLNALPDPCDCKVLDVAAYKAAKAELLHAINGFEWEISQAEDCGK